VLGENGLTEASTEDMGRMSLVDLAGVEWVLTRFGWDKVAPSAPEITLVFAADGISGGSGCNRYMASAIAGEMPGQMSVGQIAGTRMACPDEAMKLEDRYRDALKATTQYSFLAGHLVLSWNRDEDMGTLFFSSRPMSE